MDKTTLVAISLGRNAVYRFIMSDESSLQWNLSGEIEVEYPTSLRCIDDKVYVVSCDKKLQFLKREFNDIETFFENE